jgi:hypothetical protein
VDVQGWGMEAPGRGNIEEAGLVMHSFLLSPYFLYFFFLFSFKSRIVINFTAYTMHRMTNV